MVIYIGADHKGFQLKELLKNFLKQSGYTVVDLGSERFEEGDDYTGPARAVAEKVSLDYEGSRGILICGSGVGVDVVANKFRNIRSALVATPDQAFDSRHDDDANVLSLSASYTSPEAAKRILVTWLETPFDGGDRYRRRLEALARIESEVTHPTHRPGEAEYS